jgi:CheY-like chemotaxis protein
MRQDVALEEGWDDVWLARRMRCRTSVDRNPLRKRSTKYMLCANQTRNSFLARILVVDDETIVRDLLLAYLRHTGHTVLEAADGEEALSIQRNEPADLIITDNAMPRLTGREMIDILRRESPEVRIIAMSGLAVDETVRAKVERVLPKPFTKQEFLEAIRETLAD